MTQAELARSAGWPKNVASMKNTLTAGLVRCFDPVPEMMASMWLGTTPQMARDPRIKGVYRAGEKDAAPMIEWRDEGGGSGGAGRIDRPKLPINSRRLGLAI